ncbi:MAG: AAA family ATPase [Geminicoccaceae bacterium]
MKHVLAVASGKGGVGKTWFSITLGHALARMNRRVLLVDCDVGLANVDVQLGLDPSANINRAVMGEILPAQAIQPMEPLGFDVLPGRSGAGYLGGLDPLMVGWMEGELDRIGDGYDLVILDLPSGLEQGVRALMRRADEDIVLTTGEPTALTDAYALIKATRSNRRRDGTKIIVNFAEDAVAGRLTLDGLLRVCDRFLAARPEGGGVIRRDARVPEAIGRQTALLQCYPRCDAARDVMAIAAALLSARSKQ